MCLKVKLIFYGFAEVSENLQRFEKRTTNI